MKKITDEELDRQLFTALSTPPEEGLRYDFSAKLRQNLRQKLERENKLRFYISWTLFFLVVICVLFIYLQYIDHAHQTNIIEIIAKRKWIFIIGFAVIILIQYVDHTSIKSDQFKKDSKTSSGT